MHTHDYKPTFAPPYKFVFALLWNFELILIIKKTKVCWLSKNYLTLLLHYDHHQFLQYCKHILLFWLSSSCGSFFCGNTPGYYIPLEVPCLEIDSGLHSAKESKNMNSIALLLLKNVSLSLMGNWHRFVHILST